MPKKEKIQQMFNDIAPSYDRFNHLMSFGIDKNWRRSATRRLVDADNLQVLDLACGTGDFSISIAREMGRQHRQGRVTAVDISENMLKIMREKLSREEFGDKVVCRQGDGGALDFGDGTFDRISIAFGIRNFEDRRKGLSEMFRVLKKGGRAYILELSMPDNSTIASIYGFYFRNIMPLAGGLFSGNIAAYRYLPASVTAFPGQEAFALEMQECGFTKVECKSFTFGICRLWTGEKA